MANPPDVSEPTRRVTALHQGGDGSRRLPIVVPGASSAVIFQPTTQNSGNRPWKLPEPWTPRTRPPLLGKPPRTRFPTATTGPIIGNQSVTHVAGLLCYLCFRLLIRARTVPSPQHDRQHQHEKGCCDRPWKAEKQQPA